MPAVPGLLHPLPVLEHAFEPVPNEEAFGHASVEPRRSGAGEQPESGGIGF